MTAYRLKIVPNAEPNAEGEWITVQTERPFDSRNWSNTAAHFNPHVPSKHHLVACEKVAL